MTGGGAQEIARFSIENYQAGTAGSMTLCLLACRRRLITRNHSAFFYSTPNNRSSSKGREFSNVTPGNFNLGNVPVGTQYRARLMKLVVINPPRQAIEKFEVKITKPPLVVSHFGVGTKDQ